MGILCVVCVYDTIGNRCFEKISFPKTYVLFGYKKRLPETFLLRTLNICLIEKKTHKNKYFLGYIYLCLLKQ